MINTYRKIFLRCTRVHHSPFFSRFKSSTCYSYKRLNCKARFSSYKTRIRLFKSLIDRRMSLVAFSRRNCCGTDQWAIAAIIIYSSRSSNSNERSTDALRNSWVCWMWPLSISCSNTQRCNSRKGNFAICRDKKVFSLSSRYCVKV